jgi:predicted negative regulator of RcsB-dependent stress response
MSPKNKGKFGKGKSALEPEDEFVSTMGRIGAALKPHTTKIVIGCSIVMLALIGIFTYRWWNQREHARATTIYDQAVALARVPVIPDPIPEDKDEQAAEGETAEGETAEGKTAEGKTAEGEAAPTQGAALPKDENKDGIPDSFPTKSVRALAALAPLQKLRAEHGSTRVAREATLLHAAMLYDAGHYAEALDMYKKYLSDGSVDPLKTMAREGMGYAQEALAMSQEDPQARKAALDKALEIYRAIQSDDKGLERDRALYHEARILAQLGRTQEAVDALKKALELQPEGALTRDINQRLAQLQAAPAAGQAPPEGSGPLPQPAPGQGPEQAPGQTPE